jgi:deoxyribose-phosphate aldolase
LKICIFYVRHNLFYVKPPTIKHSLQTDPSLKLSSMSTITVTFKQLAKMIDHSLLHPTMTDNEICSGCLLAKEYDVAAVCIKPYSIPAAKSILEGNNVAICSVIAFPAGNSTTTIKMQEALESVKAGATEIDMVVNIGKVLSGDWDYIEHEIKMINDIVVANGAILKVIFENDYLEDEHIIQLCQICSSVEVAFVKTSTGYGFVKQENGMYTYQGATMRHLKLMREHCPQSVKVKAAGGVRTLDDLIRVRALGVTRVGATATKVMLDEAKKRGIGKNPVEVKVEPEQKAEQGRY